MNYIGRPIFQFQINWANDISRAFTYDLREVALGFGAEEFTSRQQYVASGWSVRVDLIDGSLITEFDAFTAALRGRLYGFWLPVPLEAMVITAAVSSTQFDITDQGLADSLTDSPDQHLYFTGNDVAARAAKILSVTDNGNGTERVTLDTALSPSPSPDDAVSRLHYVRLADDTESATFPRENHQQRTLAMIELPSEYASVELAEEPATFQPIYLYHFWMSSPVDYHWRFTSFASDVISANEVFTAAAITHGALRKSMKFESETVEVRATYSADHPLSFYLPPMPASRPMNLQISQTSEDDPDTVTVLFTGQIRKVNDNGQTISASCDSFLSVLRQRIPPMLIKATCSYRLFEPRTCKAKQAKFQARGFITVIDNAAQPPTVELELRFPTGPKLDPNYFAEGWLHTGEQLGFETRTIFGSTWNSGTSRLTLVLNAPLLEAIVGQEMWINPGCSGSASDCLDKFDNFDNFPGFIAVPAANPSLTAIETRTSAGDKK